MTLTNAQIEELKNEGYSFETIIVEGQEMDGLFDGENFIQHGSGNEYERSIRVEINYWSEDQYGKGSFRIKA